MNNILVVGGGLIGLLTARELSEAGLAVTILERGETGRESSWAGGGILSPLYPWRYPEPVTALAHWSQQRYEGICTDLARGGIDPQWTRNGLLMVGVGEPERTEALRWAQTYGYGLEWLDPDRLRDREPGLGLDRSALWMPEVAQVRNPRLLQALRVDLQRRGVTFREGASAEGFRVADGRVTGVRVGGGTLPASQVVLAGGAWTGELLNGTGLALPVEPVRGQMLLFKGPPGLVRRIVLAGDRYIIPRRDGRVLAGSTLERAGFEKVTTAEALADLRGAAFGIFPGLEALPLETQWAGLRPGSPTGVPYIGEHPGVAGLYINAGHFRNGVVMGLASARLLSDLFIGREPILDPSPYRPGRTEEAP